jgi:ribulose 1,5-bisphosphate synthetase/thiazole synthase
MTQTFTEPARHTPVAGEFDVLVLGGGPAGIAAAASAGRAGARTLLVERYGFLGGMGTAAGVTNFCGLHMLQDGAPKRLIEGISRDLTDRIAHYGGLKDPHTGFGKIAAQAYDNPAYKCAADDLLAAHGVKVLFHALAAGAVVEDARVSALLVETKSGRRAYRAQVFIDCSGDADLAQWAGAVTRVGDADGATAFPTMMFRVGNVSAEEAHEKGKPNLHALIAQARAAGYQIPRDDVILGAQRNSWEWRANASQLAHADGRAVSGTDADSFSWGEQEGRRQVQEFMRFLRDRVPGFANSYLLDLPPQLGIRETRRVLGDYEVTREDVLGCRDFDDAVALNCWPVERHVKGRIDWSFIEGRGYCQLPYRSLVAAGLKNLLVAGRCGSFTSEAQSAVRVSGTCFSMGEAAGLAAAMACGQADARNIAVDKLRAKLAESQLGL